MEYVFYPLAQNAGITKKKEKIRFAEQAWVFVYDSTFWTLGMVKSSYPVGRSCADTRDSVHNGQLGILAQSRGVMDQLAR